MNKTIFITIVIFAFCFMAFAQSSNDSCPQVGIILPNEMLVPGKAALFTAKIGKLTEESNIEYNWTVSRGYIIEGQGTSKIKLLVMPENFGENVIITLKLEGFPENCTGDVSEAVSVIPQPNSEPFSRYGKVSANDEKAQIDNLYYTLSQNENYEGIMLLKFDKNMPAIKKVKRLKEIIKWIEFRKFDKSRISFAISEDDSEYTTILVLQEKSKTFEDLNKDYKLVKDEDLKQKINELFPKK